MREFLVDRLSGSRLDAPARRLYSKLRGKQMSHSERRNREYDDMTLTIIRRVMARDSNSVDAGAHLGYFLRHLVRAAPQGTHYAFEPIPELAEGLRTRVPAAQVFAVALGETDTTASFHYLPRKAAQSSLHARPDRESGEEVVELTVPVKRLDDVWPRDKALNFVKIDVESAEAELLRGAAETMRRCQPVVVFECHPTGLPEVAALLEAAGLRTFLVEDFLADRQRPRREVEERALENGEWFFAARP